MPALAPSHAAATGKQYSSPALYKDYNKSTKDLLTKNYSAAGTWKVESKYKGPRDALLINPTATSDGKISADIEYAPSSCAGSMKVNVTPQGLNNLKATATYNMQGHKVEAVVHKKGGCDVDFEISHESVIMAGKRMSMNEKLNRKAIYLGLGVDVAPNCQVGCGATYDMKSNFCDWSAGCRYSNKGYEVAVRTVRLKSYITSFSAPIAARFRGKDFKINVAAETICGKGAQLDATMGVEVTCPVYQSNVLKARVTKNKEWAVAYIAKLADNWAVAVSMDKNMKAGVLLTHS